MKTCDELQETFQVHAKKNPEVKLKETHSFCPGKQDLADFVEYTWFHNRRFTARCRIRKSKGLSHTQIQTIRLYFYLQRGIIYMIGLHC